MEPSIQRQTRTPKHKPDSIRNPLLPGAPFMPEKDSIRLQRPCYVWIVPPHSLGIGCDDSERCEIQSDEQSFITRPSANLRLAPGFVAEGSACDSAGE